MRPWLPVLAFLVPTGSVADGLSFEFRPSTDPDQVVSCMIRQTGGWMFAVEVAGPGLPAPRPMRWPVRPDENAVVSAALTALARNELGPTGAAGSRLPKPPLATVTWLHKADEGMQSALYIQNGLQLPPILSQVVQISLPGGPCDRLANDRSRLYE
jgi:hypothetical protein